MNRSTMKPAEATERLDLAAGRCALAAIIIAATGWASVGPASAQGFGGGGFGGFGKFGNGPRLPMAGPRMPQGPRLAPALRQGGRFKPPVAGRGGKFGPRIPDLAQPDVIKPRPRLPLPGTGKGQGHRIPDVVSKPPRIPDGKPPKRPRVPQIVIPVPPVVTPDRPRLACDGGRIRKGDCVCPRGQVAERTGKTSYECTRIVVVPPTRLPPVAPPVVVVPPTLIDPGPGRKPPGISTAVPPGGGPGDRRPRPPAGPPSPPVVAQPPPSPALPPIAEADTIVAGEVLARFGASVPTAIDDDVARDFGLVLVERDTLGLIGGRIVRYRIPDQRQVAAVVAALAADTRVLGPQPNYVYRRQQSAASAGAASDLQYALTKVNFAAADPLSTGQGATIAIIDTGIDTEHPDLRAATVAVVDVTGGGEASEPTGGPGAHGTAIAGIIAAQGLTKGIAPKARLVGVKAFVEGRVSRSPVSTTTILARAMQRSIDEGAKVLNLSLAGPRDPIVEAVVGATAARDVIMVAAAGNGGESAPPAYPAAYAPVIAVTATDQSDRLFQKANRGPYVALAAPGVDIFVATIGKGHDIQSGTSFAAAHVSAVIGLLVQQRPALTIDAARKALIASALDLGAPGHDAEFGAGLVNAAATIAAVTASAR